MFKLVLIRPKCARIGYNQTQVRSNPPISDFSDQIDLWSNQLQTMVQTFQINFTSHLSISRLWYRVRCARHFHPYLVISVWKHTVVRSTGSDYKSIWVGTSNWVRFHWSIICFIVIVWCFRLSKQLKWLKEASLRDLIKQYLTNDADMGTTWKKSSGKIISKSATYYLFLEQTLFTTVVEIPTPVQVRLKML